MNQFLIVKKKYTYSKYTFKKSTCYGKNIL